MRTKNFFLSVLVIFIFVVGSLVGCSSNNTSDKENFTNRDPSVSTTVPETSLPTLPKGSQLPPLVGPDGESDPSFHTTLPEKGAQPPPGFFAEKVQNSLAWDTVVIGQEACAHMPIAQQYDHITNWNVRIVSKEEVDDDHVIGIEEYIDNKWILSRFSAGGYGLEPDKSIGGWYSNVYLIDGAC